MKLGFLIKDAQRAEREDLTNFSKQISIVNAVVIETKC